MIDQEWFARAGRELRDRAVPEPDIGQVLAEAAAHARDSGQPARAVFGLPEAYAARVASTLAARPAPGRAARAGEAGWAGRAGGARGAERADRADRADGVRLSARGVGKRYGRRWVIRAVDLTVRAGETVAVVGANGAGKSTFLGICAGFIAPDAGSVSVSGSVGFCPQHGGTLDYLTPQEHFVLLGAGRGMRRAEARAVGRTRAASLQWNVTGRVQGRQLSGGTRQKLNLVLAGLDDPDVLLLDEPYQGFDQGTYLDFWEQVWQWRDRGKAVVVVTHLLENLDRVDHVLDLTPRLTEGEQR